jgi:hypothetical protein
MTETTHSRSFDFFCFDICRLRYLMKTTYRLRRDCRIIRVSNDGTDTFPQFQSQDDRSIDRSIVLEASINIIMSLASPEYLSFVR